MALRAVEHSFTGTTTPYTSYDSTKTTLGKWIIQNTGSNPTDKWAGPFPLKITRPMEASTSIPSSMQHVFTVGTLHWVFLADQVSATATRRINLYTFDTSSFIWNWRGFITLTYPTATNHTIRGLRVARHLHTTGTVSSSGTTITGSGTDWSTNRMAAGARIGFGTTDPTAVVDWYYISSIASDTSLTVSLAPSTISAGTSYVIEELRVYTVTTNATTTNGGLFVAKGINFDDFTTTSGTTISAATTTDNIKAVYWLADAFTVTNTISGGIAFGGTTATNTNHDIYVINDDTTTSARMYKYNGRASLSGLSSGKSTSAFSFKTNAMTVTGTLQQNNSLVCCTLSHGPANGVSSLYFNTTTRIYRCKETSIKDSSSNFIDDNIIEIPPGGTQTFPASSAMNNFCYSSSIDRFVISCGSTVRHYVTSYYNSFNQFDRIFGANISQQDQSIADVNLPNNIINGSTPYFFDNDGILYVSKLTATTATNQLYALPISLDWDFASSNYGRLYTPEIPITNCSNLSKLFVNYSQYSGSETYAIPNEPFRVFYRTNGISDNTGSWISVPFTGDLSSVKDISSIQFMFEFRVFGTFCITSKIHSLTLTYNDYSTNTYFQPSAGKSSASSKRFAWRFSTAYGTTVPTLTIKLFDAVSGTLLLTDTTSASLYGTWQKSTDGTTWESYNSTDKSNENTYIRYIPTTLADNIKVKALLI